jgi:hypothetical protein
MTSTVQDLVVWLPMDRNNPLPHHTQLRGPRGERATSDAWDFAGRGVYVYHWKRGRPHGRLLVWDDLPRWKFKTHNDKYEHFAR